MAQPVKVPAKSENPSLYAPIGIYTYTHVYAINISKQMIYIYKTLLVIPALLLLLAESVLVFLP